MPNHFLRWQLGAVAVLLSIVFTWCLGGYGRGEATERADDQDKAKPVLQRRYYRAVGCSRSGCHGEAPKKGEIFLCRCDEYERWEKKDKHVAAYKALFSDRSKRMQQILRYDVTTSPKCVSCHGVVIKDEKEKDDKFDLKEEGVTCSICHGPYRNWFNPHGSYDDSKQWRDFPRTKKQTEYGMTDLWDPLIRAQLCASCHIGNLDQGKFITHEMYAAGHPPLPSFEVTVFSDEMPRHWQYLREKPKEVQALLKFDGQDCEQTRLILVGAVASLEQSMCLLHAQAAECRDAKEETNRVLNLSNFDCYACHHDLKSDAWRQKGGFAGKPGRVPMPRWPSVLVRLAILRAAANEGDAKKRREEYDKLLKRLQAGFGSRPYGDPGAIAAASRDLADWAKKLAAEVNKTCDLKTGREILARVPSLYKDELLDYDSARQVAWVLKTMSSELVGDKPDEKVVEVLQSLEKRLKLKLPSGRDTSIDKELEAGLKVRNGYDPVAFQKDLARLFELLGK